MASELPAELANQWEDGSYLGSCDMGYCDNEQEGWALVHADARGMKCEWLASCGACGRFEKAPPEGERMPLEFIPFPAFAEEGEDRG